MILPWSEEKKKRFIKMYDVEKISCIGCGRNFHVAAVHVGLFECKAHGVAPGKRQGFRGASLSCFAGTSTSCRLLAAHNLAAATL